MVGCEDVDVKLRLVTSTSLSVVFEVYLGFVVILWILLALLPMSGFVTV